MATVWQIIPICLRSLALFLSLQTPGTAVAQEKEVPASIAPPAETAKGIGLSFRHMVILQADLKNIWGTYYFAVMNHEQSPQMFSAPVMLPKEAVDFRAQDGLSDGDLQLDAAGKLYVKKEFAPGLNLLGIGFQVKAQSDEKDSLTFLPPLDLEEFSLAVPKGMELKLEGKHFKEGLPPMLANGRYDGIISIQPLVAQQEVQIQLIGIPKGRWTLWLIGASVLGMLTFMAFLLSYKTLPAKIPDGKEEVFL